LLLNFFGPTDLSSYMRVGPASFVKSTSVLAGFRCRRNTSLRHFAKPSPNFTGGGVKKYEIWPRFSTPVEMQQY